MRSPGRHSLHGSTDKSVKQVSAGLLQSAGVHKLRIRLESGFRWIGTFYFRTKKRPSPRQPTGLLGKCRPVTCTCLSQTGESPGRHSLHGAPGKSVNQVFAGFLQSAGGHKLRIKLESGFRWIGAFYFRTKKRPSPRQPTGLL